MSNKELIGIFHDDIPEWERAPFVELLTELSRIRSVRIEEGVVAGSGRGKLVWVVGRDWKRALASAKRTKADRFFVSLMGAGGQPPSLPTLFVRKFKPLINQRVHLLTHSLLNYRFFQEIEGMTDHQLTRLDLPCPERIPKPRGAQPGFTVGVLTPFTRDSNLNYLFNVAHYVARELPQVKFRVFGEGKLRDHAMAMTRDLGLESNVSLESGNQAEGLADVDLLAFCPLRNHHFIPLQWGASYRLPVVSSEVPGIEQFIKEGHTGFVVPINETKPMAELVIRLLMDPRLAQTMGQNLHEDLTQRLAARHLLSQFDDFFFGSGSSLKPVVQAA